MDLLQISLEVEGKDYPLTPPTPRIAFAISRLLGGVGPALARCQAGDLDAYKVVLKNACPDAPNKEEELEAFIFANVDTINWPLCRYAQSLQYGGRSGPMADDSEEAGESGTGPGKDVGPPSVD